MNITFLIGNGFDVGLGMMSKFKEFFPIYQVNSLKKKPEIRQLAEEIGNDYETWADFEAALGKYTEKFNEENKQNLIEQVKDFEEEFIEYLKERETLLSFANSENISFSMVKALNRFYLDGNIPPESEAKVLKVFSNHIYENHNYNFINFNYTHALKKCLSTISDNIINKRKIKTDERVDKVGEMVHVHGQCGLYPIIGVNDVSQIANEVLAKDKHFTRFLVKPSLNSLLRYGNDAKATDLINTSKIICIYGMSLGSTDKKWWDLLIKWLKNDTERQLIIFDYDRKFSPANQFAWIEKEDSYIEKLKIYSSDTSIDVEQMRKRIHIAVHKNIFEIDLTEKQRKITELAFEQMKEELITTKQVKR